LTKNEKLFLAIRKAMRKVLSAEDRKRILKNCKMEK